MAEAKAAAKQEDTGPKMRQFHWDVMTETKGTIWASEDVASGTQQVSVDAAPYPISTQ